MAKYIGLLTSDARGKVGGIIMGRANSGTTLKSHAVPINPRTVNQFAQRAAVGQANHAWGTLSGSDQVSWMALALQYVYVNSLAQSYSPTGRQLYTQAFSNAARFGDVPPSTAPAVKPAIQPIDNVLAALSGGTLTLTAQASGLDYSGNWICQCSSSISPGIIYTKGVRRNFMGASVSVAALDVTAAFTKAYGPPASPHASLSVRVVPTDPTGYVSGTPALISVSY